MKLLKGLEFSYTNLKLEEHSVLYEEKHICNIWYKLTLVRVIKFNVFKRLIDTLLQVL